MGTIFGREQFEGGYHILLSAHSSAIYSMCVIVRLARGIHTENVVYSEKEQLVDGVRYKKTVTAHCFQQFAILKLFITNHH